MAFTRKLLESMGLNEQQVSAVIDAHIEVVDALKQERDGYKAQAESIAELEKERDSLREQLSKAGDAAKVQAEFDAYKAKVEADRVNAVKEQALRRALKEAGVQREEFIDLLMGKADLTVAEMDGDKLRDADALIAPLREAYGGCFATTQMQGAPTVNPPTGGLDKRTMTHDEIINIKDKNARMKAIAENGELFGI